MSMLRGGTRPKDSGAPSLQAEVSTGREGGLAAGWGGEKYSLS